MSIMDLHEERGAEPKTVQKVFGDYAHHKGLQAAGVRLVEFRNEEQQSNSSAIIDPSIKRASAQFPDKLHNTNMFKPGSQPDLILQAIVTSPIRWGLNLEQAGGLAIGGDVGRGGGAAGSGTSSGGKGGGSKVQVQAGQKVPAQGAIARATAAARNPNALPVAQQVAAQPPAAPPKAPVAPSKPGMV